MSGERVAVIGGGGREAVMLDKYLQSEHVRNAIAIPGNDMMKIGKEKPVETFPMLKTTYVKQIVRLCRERGISFVDVAQDNAVQSGLVDALRREGIPVLGPTKSAGIIEWSKSFSRRFGERHGLMQPGFRIFNSEESGISAINSMREVGHVFIKANGLANGKGVKSATTRNGAIEAIMEMRKFGRSGKRYLIEDALKNDDGTNGEEFSFFAISDGKDFKLLGNARDYKKAWDHDTGENTGGMGSSSPHAMLTESINEQVRDIFRKTIDGLNAEGRTYTGILYFGGMLVRIKNELVPYAIEWNARWGDPEAQVIIPGIRNDFMELGQSVLHGGLNGFEIQTDGMARVAVAGVSKGYPGDYNDVIGKEIFGLGRASRMPGVRVYGAGIKIEEGKCYASGGRLFYIVGEGESLLEAQMRAYDAMLGISIDGGHNLDFRTDIALKDIARTRR